MKKQLPAEAFISCTSSFPVFSLSFSINADGSTAHTSAILDIKNTTKGLLIARMTTAEQTSKCSPATGLQVYDSDLNLLYFYNGTTWAGIRPGTNYRALS